MAIQLSIAVRNNGLDEFESTTGTAALLRILTGAQPADCATAESGTELVEITLPTDWVTTAAAGAIALIGTWQATATATGTAGYFRILDSGGTTCHMQGSVGQGSGDLSLDNTSIANGQSVQVDTFALTAGNA